MRKITLIGMVTFFLISSLFAGTEIQNGELDGEGTQEQSRDVDP